jgi:hypothetical protein
MMKNLNEIEAEYKRIIRKDECHIVVSHQSLGKLIASFYHKIKKIRDFFSILESG